MVDSFLKDLRECVEAVRQMEQLDTDFIREQIGRMLADPSPEVFAGMAAMAGIQGSELPQEMALINEVLDALPDEYANQLLIEYFNDLYV